MVINLTFVAHLNFHNTIFEDRRQEITGTKDLLSNGIA